MDGNRCAEIDGDVRGESGQDILALGVAPEDVSRYRLVRLQGGDDLIAQ